MHEDELDIHPELVRRLLRAQFPRWAALPITRVASSGTSNALYRLGDDLVARLPRDPTEHGIVEKEWRWLPLLAPRLPLASPVPLALGKPDADYPVRWSVCRWLEGQEATREALGESVQAVQAARDLAGFILALRGIDATGAPEPGAHNFGRGEPLAARDEEVREALAALRDALPTDFDWDAAEAVWDDAVNALVWEGEPVWVHGDLYAANLLTREGRLSAVIDFGGLGAGDPAVDLMPAWNLFTGAARTAFRETLLPDEAMWLRGRGWALSMSLIALPYYLHTNPAMVALSRATISEVLASHQRTP